MRLHHNHKKNKQQNEQKRKKNYLSIYLSIAIAKVYQPRDPSDAILQISTDRPLHK